MVGVGHKIVEEEPGELGSMKTESSEQPMWVSAKLNK